MLETVSGSAPSATDPERPVEVKSIAKTNKSDLYHSNHAIVDRVIDLADVAGGVLHESDRDFQAGSSPFQPVCWRFGRLSVRSNVLFQRPRD